MLHYMSQSLQQVKRIQIQKYHNETDPDEKAKILLDPLKVFHAAIENCKPLLKLTPIKRGGATYQVSDMKKIIHHITFAY